MIDRLREVGSMLLKIIISKPKAIRSVLLALIVCVCINDRAFDDPQKLDPSCDTFK